MGSPLLAIFSVLPILNAAACVIAAIVAALCLFLSRVMQHIPDWMTVPPIMMTGNIVPESVIYSGGLTVVAICLMVCQSLMFLLRRAMLQRDWKPEDKNLPLRFTNVCEYSFSIVAAIALIAQAVVPAQENVLYTFYDFVTVEDNTVTHETAAACWWMAEAIHWILNFIVENHSQQLSILRRHRSFWAKFAFVVIAIGSGVIALFLKPKLPAPKSTVSLYFHSTNFCWWLSSVAFFVAYFVQSWQAAALLDHLGIRSFVFGTLSSTKHFSSSGQEVIPADLISRNVEEGQHHRRE